MTYCHTTTLEGVDFDAAVGRVEQALGREGFGVLTRIDVQDTLRRKLDVAFPPYLILGACNPGFAHQALTAEPHIGVMLPCNVVVRACGRDLVEVSAVDPVASMQAVDNPALGELAVQVREKLISAIHNL